MDPQVVVADHMDRSRDHQAVAYRMLGLAAEADDALQETWLRASRADTSSVVSMTGWLTTIVSRVCLDVLRSRRRRGEQFTDMVELDAAVAPDAATRRR